MFYQWCHTGISVFIIIIIVINFQSEKSTS
jgi:hypothetical protein